MKKKRLALISLSLAFASVFAITFANSNGTKGLFKHFVLADDYNLTLDNTLKPSLNGGSGILNYKSATFTYENAADYAEGHVKLLENGTIKKDRANDLGSINVVFDGYLEVQTAYEEGKYCNSYTLASGTNTPIVGNFLKIIAVYDTNITSINVHYGCGGDAAIDTAVNRLGLNDRLRIEAENLTPLEGAGTSIEETNCSGGKYFNGGNAKYEIPFYVSADSEIYITTYMRTASGAYPLHYYFSTWMDNESFNPYCCAGGQNFLTDDGAFHSEEIKNYETISAGQHILAFKLEYTIHVDYIEFATRPIKQDFIKLYTDRATKIEVENLTAVSGVSGAWADASCSNEAYGGGSDAEYHLNLFLPAEKIVQIEVSARFQGNGPYYLIQQTDFSLNGVGAGFGWKDIATGAGGSFSSCETSVKGVAGLNTFSFKFNYTVDIDYIKFALA